MKTQSEYTQDIKASEKFGLFLSGVGNVPLYVILMSFLTYFYTNVVGVNAGIVGGIMLVSKVFDGVSDLIFGNMIERTRTEKGTCRPWILRMSVLMAFAIICLFTVPATGVVGKSVYIFITYNVSQTLIYTISTLAITSLPTYMTRDNHQQTALYLCNNLGFGVAQIVVTSITLSLVNHFGGTQKSWIIVACIYGCVSAIILLIVGNVCKEHVNPEEFNVKKEEKVPFSTALKSVLKNKYWFYLLGLQIFSLGIFTSSLQMHMYYAENILGDVNFASQLNTFYTAPGLVLTIVLFIVSQTVNINNKKVVFSAIIVQSVGIIMIMVAPNNLTILLIATALKGLGSNCVTAMYLPMLGATVEYGQWKTGVRTQAMLMGAYGTGQKIGNGLVSALLGIVMSVAGYNGMAEVQSSTALASISGLYIYLPLIFTIIELIFLKLYDLDKRYDGIMNDLKERANNA